MISSMALRLSRSVGAYVFVGCTCRKVMLVSRNNSDTNIKKMTSVVSHTRVFYSFTNYYNIIYLKWSGDVAATGVT